MRRLFLFIGLFFGFLFLSCQILAADPVLLKKMDAHELSHCWRFTFHLAGPAKYKLFELDNPKRVILDFDNVYTEKELSYQPTFDSPITNIRYAAHQDHQLRIVFEIDGPIQTQIENTSTPDSDEQSLQLSFIKTPHSVTAFSWPTKEDSEEPNKKPDLLRESVENSVENSIAQQNQSTDTALLTAQKKK